MESNSELIDNACGMCLRCIVATGIQATASFNCGFCALGLTSSVNSFDLTQFTKQESGSLGGSLVFHLKIGKINREARSGFFSVLH